MPHNTNLFYLSILLILSSACGPLVPLSYLKNSTDFNFAQTIESEEATVTLEYLDSKYGHYIFDMEEINHTSTTLDIAPQVISFYASPKLFTPLSYSTGDVHTISAPNSALTKTRQFANSPAETRNIYQEKVKSKESFIVLFAVLGAGLIIYDAVKDSEDSQKEKWAKKDVNKAIGRDALVSIALTASDVAEQSAYQAEEDNYYLPFELFPECEIKPGASVRGKVYVPIETSYRYSRVVVPLLNTDYVFDFKRRSVKATQSPSLHHPSMDDPRR